MSPADFLGDDVMDGWQMLRALAEWDHSAVYTMLFASIGLAFNPRIFGAISALLIVVFLLFGY